MKRRLLSATGVFATLLPGLVVMSLLVLFMLGTARWVRRVAVAARTAGIYTVQDDFYVAPVVREFEPATGVKVRAWVEGEAGTTVGLSNQPPADRTLQPRDGYRHRRPPV